MQKLLLRFSALLLLTCFLQTVRAQQIDSVMEIYSDQFPVEKMHIHFDKSTYNKEESIWYKIYILADGKLTEQSKNVYVEWYDTTGKMLLQTVAPLFQSSAKGSFDLPADYKGSYIHVKAYTRWMLNDDSVFSYERDLLINNSVLAGNKPIVASHTKLELFPEGGFLVQGISSKLAFKATNQYGNPVMVKGVLVDAKGNVIDSLHVQHDGMGVLLIQPLAGETYKINWIDDNGNTGSVAVVDIKPRGAVMSITATNDKAFVRVDRSLDAEADFRQFFLLVHMNQQLFFKAQLKGADRSMQQAVIPIDALPTGILQFSLFTSNWMPVAERILFVNNHLHEFNAKIIPQQISLEKKGKNIIDIQVSDTALANMSIAITDVGVPVPEENTIFSDMLLSGELRGRIYNPAYYLKSDADTITGHLDLVMLTHGWRRFDWDKVKAGILPTVQYPAETILMKVGGRVLGIKSFNAASPLMINAILISKDSSKHLMFLPVEKDGSFEDNTAFFYDTVRVYYNLNNANKFTEGLQVQFENGLLKQMAKKIKYGSRDPWSLYTDSLAKLRMNTFFARQEQMRKSMAAATLQEVTVKTRIKKYDKFSELDKKYASGLFSGGDSYSFDFLEDPFASSARDIFTFLQGRVAGLQISSSGGEPSLNWRGGQPSLFLDEVQASVDMLQAVSVSDIAYVKVFRPPFFGAGGGGSGGAIAVYTRKGGDARPNPDNNKGMQNVLLGGYSRFKEFYHPSYEKPTESFETDIRTTLYWNAYLLTDQKNPKHRIQFYNNDISSQLRIVIEGMNADGKMVRVVKILDANTKD